MRGPARRGFLRSLSHSANPSIHVLWGNVWRFQPSDFLRGPPACRRSTAVDTLPSRPTGTILVSEFCPYTGHCRISRSTEGGTSWPISLCPAPATPSRVRLHNYGPAFVLSVGMEACLGSSPRTGGGRWPKRCRQDNFGKGIRF